MTTNPPTIELKTSPEETHTRTRVIFNVFKEHNPLTIAER
jgi:hypothetical protein